MTRRSFLVATLVAPFVPRVQPPSIGLTQITTRVVVVDGNYQVTYCTTDALTAVGRRITVTVPDGTVLDDGFVQSVEQLW